MSARDPASPDLKLGFNRVQGFFIEVARRDAERVPKDYLRRQTVKSAERFITPELKSFEDKVLGARERALTRERKLYEAVLDELTLSLGSLQVTAAALAELDALAALAERAVTLDWVAPRARARGRIVRIVGGRHPVVERFCEDAFVPNDLDFDAERRMLIITGPNMGGKSTYHAPGGAHRAAGARGQFRACGAGGHRARGPHLHPHRRGG